MTRTTAHRWSSPELILVATNLLESQLHILQAIYQAKLSGAKVLLVHVVPPSFQKSLGDHEIRVGSDTNPLANVHAAMDQMTREFQHAGISCEAILLNGFISDQILALARARDVDRLVVASSSQPPLDRIHTQTVLNRLIAASDVPVFVIGPRARLGSSNGEGVGRVLLATSLHPGSELSANFAIAFAEMNQMHLTLLHVVDTGGLTEIQREESLLNAEQRLALLLGGESRLWCQPTTLVREGDVVSEIVQGFGLDAEDLVVLGCDEELDTSRTQTYETLNRIIAAARSPVAIVRAETASVDEPGYAYFSQERRVDHR